MQAPDFSIVIPAFNRPEELRRTLASCRSQTHETFEVLVIDDGSSEDLGRVVRDFEDPRFIYIRQENAGACAARNRGIDAARAPWIALLDSDDIFHPRKLEICAKFIADRTWESGGEAPAMIYHLIDVDRGAGKVWRQPERLPRPDETLAEFLFCAHQHIMTSAMLVRTDVARSIRFDETMPMWQDLDFKVRLAHAGHAAIPIDRSLGGYDDTGSAGRVSRGRHKARLTAWLESARPWMSEKAHAGFRANVLAAHFARETPLRSALDIAMGVIRGGVPVKTALRRSIRAYFPGLYAKLAVIWLRRFGA
jgi:glycosyltransferase involved in cell wall biosynthesis